MPTDEEKGKAHIREKRRFFAYLDTRIPELHAAGVEGRLARTQAQEEYAGLSEEERDSFLEKKAPAPREVVETGAKAQAGTSADAA